MKRDYRIVYSTADGDLRNARDPEPKSAEAASALGCGASSRAATAKP